VTAACGFAIEALFGQQWKFLKRRGVYLRIGPCRRNTAVNAPQAGPLNG
jgi:hypothetical protein